MLQMVLFVTVSIFFKKKKKKIADSAEFLNTIVKQVLVVVYI